MPAPACVQCVAPECLLCWQQQCFCRAYFSFVQLHGIGLYLLCNSSAFADNTLLLALVHLLQI